MIVQDAPPFSATLQLGHGFQQMCSAEGTGAEDRSQSQTYVWQVLPTLGLGRQLTVIVCRFQV